MKKQVHLQADSLTQATDKGCVNSSGTRQEVFCLTKSGAEVSEVTKECYRHSNGREKEWEGIAIIDDVRLWGKSRPNRSKPGMFGSAIANADRLRVLRVGNSHLESRYSRSDIQSRLQNIIVETDMYIDLPQCFRQGWRLQYEAYVSDELCLSVKYISTFLLIFRAQPNLEVQKLNPRDTKAGLACRAKQMGSTRSGP